MVRGHIQMRPEGASNDIALQYHVDQISARRIHSFRFYCGWCVYAAAAAAAAARWCRFCCLPVVLKLPLMTVLSSKARIIPPLPSVNRVFDSKNIPRGLHLFPSFLPAQTHPTVKATADPPNYVCFELFFLARPSPSPTMLTVER